MREKLKAMGLSEQQINEILGIVDQDVAGLKLSKEQILAEKKELQKKMERVKDLDPEKYLEMQTRLQQLEQKDLEGQKDWEKLKQIKELEQKQLVEKYTKEQQKLTNELKEAKISALEAEFIRHGANPQTVKGLIAMQEKNGNLQFAIDEAGSKVIFMGKEVKTEKVGETTITHGIHDWLQDTSSQAWLLPKGNEGSGQNSLGNKGLPTKSVKEWTNAEKIEFTQNNGFEKYQELLKQT
jgi:uncharacterized protein YqfA (UPF0365 family)